MPAPRRIGHLRLAADLTSAWPAPHIPQLPNWRRPSSIRSTACLCWRAIPLTTLVNEVDPKLGMAVGLYEKSPAQILLPYRSRRIIGRLGLRRQQAGQVGRRRPSGMHTTKSRSCGDCTGKNLHQRPRCTCRSHCWHNSLATLRLRRDFFCLHLRRDPRQGRPGTSFLNVSTQSAVI